METMVERVARALCRADGLDPDADWRDQGAVFLTFAIEPGKAQCWRTYEAKARAAIEAMREPTTAMTSAFDAACDEHGHCLARFGYRIMIDAALA